MNSTDQLYRLVNQMEKIKKSLADETGVPLKILQMQKSYGFKITEIVDEVLTVCAIDDRIQFYKCRLHNYVKARYLAMYFITFYCPIKQAKIGSHFELGRDGVSYGIKIINDRLQAGDKLFIDAVKKIDFNLYKKMNIAV